VETVEEARRYRQRWVQFKPADLEFGDNLKDYASHWRPLLVENFQIIVPPLPNS